jgi:release factor glutamine methyltransferase
MEHAGFPSPLYLREPQVIPEPSIITQINEIVSEIHTHKPIQYILGYTYFCDLKILVNQNVLIPRPETEEMVDKIIRSHHKMPSSVLDIGTGSGCIALALKNNFRSSVVTGLDISRDALKVAGDNARLNKLDIRLVEGDILQESSWPDNEKFGLIVSNPPYITTSEKPGIAANVLNFEPEQALFVDDKEPFVYYESIAAFSRPYLNPGGMIWVEINERYGDDIAGIFRDHGFENIIIHKDIHEKERFIEAQRS